MLMSRSKSYASTRALFGWTKAHSTATTPEALGNAAAD